MKVGVDEEEFFTKFLRWRAGYQREGRDFFGGGVGGSWNVTRFFVHCFFLIINIDLYLDDQ